MNLRITRVLAAACALGAHATSARADDPAPEPATAPPETIRITQDAPMLEQVSTAASVTSTSVQEDYLVLPEGEIVGGSLRTITADGGLGTGKLALTDLALFDAHLEWAIAERYELDASVSVLAKQPSAADADTFQGGSLTLRRALPHATALALGGSASPLLGLHGAAYGASLFLTHKKRLNEIVTFAMAAGVDATALAGTALAVTPMFVEAAAHGAVLVRIPNGVWGGWLGAGYALPAFHRGDDPISGMTLDPQARLDVDLGTGVALGDDWYFAADIAIIDRGDLSNPATRIPVLDGGFDQVQVMLSVTRRVRDRHGQERVHDVSGPLIQL